MAAAATAAASPPSSISSLFVGRSSVLASNAEFDLKGTTFSSPLQQTHQDAESSAMARHTQRKVVLHCSFAGCQKTFTKACKLHDHERSHTGERPFVCEIDGCQKDFKRKDHLQRHQRSHTTKNEDGDVEDQESIRQARPFQCTVIVSATANAAASTCERRFLTRQHLSRHIREYHDQSTSCDEAPAKSVSIKQAGGQDAASKLRKQRARRPATYVCEIEGCDEAFTKRKLLRAHVTLAHSDRNRLHEMDLDRTEAERIVRLPFPCTHQHCTKRFATNSKRMAHIQQKHNTTGRYVCMHDHTQDGTPGGVAQFANWSALQAHQRSAHNPTCPFADCGKQFKETRNLRQHLCRIHGCKDDGSQGGGDGGGITNVDGSMEFSGDTDIERAEALRCSNSACTRLFGSIRSMKRHSSRCGKSVKRPTADAEEADVSENDTESESESDDDFFRREGGAVPEEAADRGKTQKRRRWDQGDAGIESFSLTSLTGRAYSQANSEAVSSSKKRRTRGRVLGCPWRQICQLRDQQEKAHINTTDDHVPSCSFRFSRLYDVQRHLRGVHKVNFTQVDIESLILDEERQLLGTPRPGTQVAKASTDPSSSSFEDDHHVA